MLRTTDAEFKRHDKANGRKVEHEDCQLSESTSYSADSHQLRTSRPVYLCRRFILAGGPVGLITECEEGKRAAGHRALGLSESS